MSCKQPRRPEEGQASCSNPSLHVNSQQPHRITPTYQEHPREEGPAHRSLASSHLSSQVSILICSMPFSPRALTLPTVGRKSHCILMSKSKTQIFLEKKQDSACNHLYAYHVTLGIGRLQEKWEERPCLLQLTGQWGKQTHRENRSDCATAAGSLVSQGSTGGTPNPVG